MAINGNITEKNYRKLTLLAGVDGFSYAVTDTLNNRVLDFETVDFTALEKTNKVEDLYWKAFLNHKQLTQSFDEVIVVHDNNLNTFVPKPLFDDELLGSYLQYNTKVFETDFFAYDSVDNYEINNVYIPYVNINNYLIEQFGPFEYRHANSTLVGKLLDISKNVDEKQLFVHFSKNTFEIIVVQNQKLLLFNSFEFQNAADFIYYLLFSAEQLQLNPEHFKLKLLGAIDEDSEFYKMAYKYVRHVNLLDLPHNNSFSNAQNRKHFILFQS